MYVGLGEKTMNPKIKKAQEEYLAEFDGDQKKAYMNVPSNHPAFLRYKEKVAKILEEL